MGIHTKLLLTLAVLFCFTGIGQAETRVFDLQHRSAEDVESLVREMLGPQAKVVAFRNSLVVVADPDEMALAAELVERFDRAPRMLRIIVEQGRSEQRESRRIGGSGQVDSDSIQIEVGRQPGHRRQPESRVVVRSGQGQISAYGHDRSQQEQRLARQYLVLMEGQPGRLLVGTAIPFTAELRALCQRHGVVLATVAYQNVDTGFEVFPAIVGDAVEVDIRPFMAFQDARNAEQVVFQELTSHVRVPFGQWFDLGGHMASQSEVGREIMALSRKNIQENSNVRIKVERPE